MDDVAETPVDYRTVDIDDISLSDSNTSHMVGMGLYREYVLYKGQKSSLFQADMVMKYNRFGDLHVCKDNPELAKFLIQVSNKCQGTSVSYEEWSTRKRAFTILCNKRDVEIFKIYNGGGRRVGRLPSDGQKCKITFEMVIDGGYLKLRLKGVVYDLENC